MRTPSAWGSEGLEPEDLDGVAELSGSADLDDLEGLAGLDLDVRTALLGRMAPDDPTWHSPTIATRHEAGRHEIADLGEPSRPSDYERRMARVDRGRDSYRVRWRDLALVTSLGLGQVTTLGTFLLVVTDVVRGLAPADVGAAAAAQWHRTLTELAVLAGVVVVHAWLRAVEFSVSEKVGYRITQQLRTDMHWHLQGMTRRQLQYRARGGILLRFVGDLSMLRTWISRGLLSSIVAVIVLVGVTTVVAILNLFLALAMLGILLLGAAASLHQGQAMRSATRAMRRRRSLVTSNIDEQLGALHVVQTFGRSRGERSRLIRQSNSLNRALFRMADLRGRLRGLSAATSLLLVVAVLAVGAVEVHRGAADLGLVVGLLALSRQVATPVRTIALAHDYWHRAVVSRQKVRDFLRSSTRDRPTAERTPLRARRGGIRFDHACVEGAVEDVTATIQPGDLVAVVGAVGSGKSTLLDLVSRQVEPTSGRVLVDDQDLTGCEPASVARSIGVAGPNLPLMRGTVLRNLTYGRPAASPHEIQRVLMATGLDRIIAELPEGLATWVTERGENLSGGQRQWIALARAMMGNPPVLLLDEPTAQLDAASKARLIEVVRRYRGTVLLVTHDPAGTAHADQVWQMAEGRLVAVTSGDDFRERARLRSLSEAS